jgi:hypothetical protein
MAALHGKVLTEWRDQMLEYIVQGRKSGEVTANHDDEVFVHGLLAMLMGVQSNAVLAPPLATPGTLVSILDDLLGRLVA